MANDQWSGQDKAQHFIASAMLSAAGNEYAQHQGLVAIAVPFMA
jgi:putative lipoprotein